MATIPHGAKTLIKQIESRYKTAKAEPVGEDDGFGVKRSIRFDKTSSKFLAKVLPFLDDWRIFAYYEDDGQVTVVFSGDIIADQRHEFALDDAETVANDSAQ